MHNALLLALWVIVSFFLYKIIAYVINERRHSRAAALQNCELPVRIKGLDPIGIENISKMLKADKACRVPQYLKERTDAIREQEGKPLATFYQNLLGSQVVFTVDPKNIQTILATKFKDFGLGDTRNFNFYPLLGWGIFSTDGKQWEHSRALLRPQFARDQVSDLDLEERHVLDMMKALPVNQGTGWTDAVDVMPLFFRLTIDSATEFLFGESVDSQLANLPGYMSNRPPMAVSEQDFAYSFDAAQASIAKAARFGDAYWLVHDRSFKENCRRCHTFIDHYVQIALSKEKSPSSAQATTQGKPKYVFLDALAESTRDPIELRGHMLNILLAGRDTTASLLSFTFMILAQHPEYYNKLRAVVLKEFGTYTNPNEITFSGLKSCNYLQWVLNEALRLYPVVPIDGRCALVDTTLPTGGGPEGNKPVYIRKGTLVDYSVYVMHRRKDLWGEDADDFKPERWSGRKAGWEYLPFNGGPRICIGQQFALTEAGYVIVRMLQRFDAMEGAENSWDPVEKGGYGFVRQYATLTTRPADGVKVKLREAKE